MESKNKLKEIHIKNHACYHFDEIIRVEDIDFHILLDEKSYKNILAHDISYKTFMGAKPLHIRFDKVNRIIKIYDGIRYLEIFGPRIYNAIYDRINYLISKKKWC